MFDPRTHQLDLDLDRTRILLQDLRELGERDALAVVDVERLADAGFGIADGDRVEIVEPFVSPLFATRRRAW